MWKDVCADVRISIKTSMLGLKTTAVYVPSNILHKTAIACAASSPLRRRIWPKPSMVSVPRKFPTATTSWRLSVHAMDSSLLYSYSSFCK